MQNAKKRVAAVFATGLAALLLFELQSVIDRQPPVEHASDTSTPAARVSAVAQSQAAGERVTVKAAAQRPTAGHEGASAPPQGHSIGFYAGSERKEIRIAELERLLEASDGEFRELEQDIHTELTTILKGDSVTQSMDVRCAEGFCRIKLDKPVDQGMAWHEIDSAIAPVTQGEMVFGAEPNGAARTTAYVYFARDSQLPIAAAVRPPDEE